MSSGLLFGAVDGGREPGVEVAGHASVDDVAELSLQDAHRFFLGVTATACVS